MIRPVADIHRHLVCVPYSVRNLHRMATDLRIKKCWFHRDHYDIPKTRVAEIEKKSLIVSSSTIVRLIRNHSNPARSIRMSNMPTSTTENHDHESILFEKYKQAGKTGLHYCPEWDFMVIHDKSPEFDACTCDLKGIYKSSP